MTRHLLDSSVWLAIAVSGHEHHPIARAWFETVRSPDTFHFCRPTQQSFLRLLSTAAFHAQFDDVPLTNERAWIAYDQMTTASPKLWMDAYLAAFARAGGYRFVTLEGAFRQFEGLDVLVLNDTTQSL